MKKYNINIEGDDFKVIIDSVTKDQACVSVNGRQFNVTWEEETSQATETAVVKSIPKPSPAPQASKPAAASNESAVKSPLPGIILDLKVKEGDTVKEGQVVAVIEAMKMENDIEAERGGKVKSVNVTKGDSVLQGSPIITFE